MGFVVRAAGQYAREPQHLVEQLSVENAASVTAHAVQPHYTALLAQACNLSISVASETGAVTITAS